MSSRGILDADMRTVGQWLDNARVWWLGELAEMVPQRLRDWAAARRMLADYVPASGEILTRLHPGSGYPGLRAAVAVVLPVGFCLTREIERPVMSARDLDRMIQLECHRLMPMAASEAVLAARILARSEDNRRMRVEVAAMPRAAAERLGESLAGMSAKCLGVLAQAPEPHQPAPIDFLPALRRAGMAGSARSTTVALWLCVGFLFALNIGVLVWRDVAAVQNLDDLVSQQQPAVDAAHRIAARTQGLDRITEATADARRFAEPVTIMAKLRAALPPGVWLQRLVWKGDALRITGYRPASADVSGALRHAGFQVTRYSDTASTGQGKLGQPFEIQLRMKRS